MADLQLLELRDHGRREHSEIGAKATEQCAECGEDVIALLLGRAAQHTHEPVEQLRRVLSQVEARAQPAEEPHGARARAARRVVLLAKPQHSRHDKVQVLLQILIEDPERVQHLERGPSALGAVRVQDGEQLGHERREMTLKLVAQCEAQLLEHSDAVHLDAARQVQMLLSECKHRGHVATHVQPDDADQVAKLLEGDLAQLRTAIVARMQQPRQHDGQKGQALRGAAQAAQDAHHRADDHAVLRRERRVTQDASERTQRDAWVKVGMRWLDGVVVEVARRRPLAGKVATPDAAADGRRGGALACQLDLNLCARIGSA